MKPISEETRKRTSKIKKVKPNPGSPEAIMAGCECPVLDNEHGRGIDGEGSLFWINQKCPIHGQEKI